MCTVTFIPSKENIILTSNRDEKHWRLPAHPPAKHAMETGNILFPKDGDAGGTWFGVHENGNALIFLNGGFVKHEPAPPYRKSRGLILLDMLDTNSPWFTFLSMDLHNIEPFTAIGWEENFLFECRWDGVQKYARQLDTTRQYIWSSATLYSDEIIEKRRKWFGDWLLKNPSPSQDDILHFHQFTGDGDSHNDLRMNRDGKVFTVSVTSVAIQQEKADLRYIDLKNDIDTRGEIVFTNTSVDKP
jgi:hypothetical protein